MSADTALNPSLRRLMSGCEWSGYLTTENAHAVGDRLKALIGDKQRYTFVYSHELHESYLPEVRTSQVADRIVVRVEGDHADVSLHDTYGYWWIDSNAVDQSDARSRDVKTQAYVRFRWDRVEVTQYTISGHKVHAVIAVERGE